MEDPPPYIRPDSGNTSNPHIGFPVTPEPARLGQVIPEFEIIFGCVIFQSKFLLTQVLVNFSNTN